MANFGSKAWTNPFGKLSIFRLLNFSFLQPRKVFSRSRISSNTFSWPLVPKKNQVKKMANFEPTPSTNPFGTLSIFRLFELLGFIAQKSVFSFQNIIKHIFLAYIAYNTKVQKWPILDQNRGLTTLEHCQFFDFWNFLVFYPRKVFFRSRI